MKDNHYQAILFGLVALGFGIFTAIYFFRGSLMWLLLFAFAWIMGDCAVRTWREEDEAESKKEDSHGDIR